MRKSVIGCGSCSKYYLYILGTAVFKCLRDCMFGFNTINPNSKIGLFGFIPALSNHFLVQSLYRYLSFVLGGAFVVYFLYKHFEEKTIIKKTGKNEELKFKGLIHNKKKNISEKPIISQIIKVCLIYWVHAELSRIMYFFDFSGLDFWIADVVFVLIFMNKNFVINYYKHQKYSMAFIIISITTLLLISSFLPFTNHDDVNESYITDKNTYQITKDITGSNYGFIIIILIFSSIACLISYQRVKEKVLMDFYYLSPFKLIFYIGILGSILTTILLTISSNFNCSDKHYKDFCTITRTNNNITEYYYDNIIIYFEELSNKNKNYEFYLEIFLMPPLYLLISFLEFSCEILTITFLNPNFVLVRDNIYYGTSRLIFFLFNLNKNYKHYMTLAQFIILEMTEMAALIGYAVYLEIIELRFFGFDQDLKRNIIERGVRESTLKPVNLEDSSYLMNDSFDDIETENNNIYNSNELNEL